MTKKAYTLQNALGVAIVACEITMAQTPKIIRFQSLTVYAVIFYLGRCDRSFYLVQ